MPTARAVVDALRPFDNTLDPQRLAEQASSTNGPLSLMTLRQADNDTVAGAIGALPGVVITPQPEMLPTDDALRPGPRRRGQEDRHRRSSTDQPGWRVVSVNQNGVDVDVLNEVPGTPAPSVSHHAWTARCRTPRSTPSTSRAGKAMIVVIKPSTGEILAVAQNAAADARARSPPWACIPPGSTFKIVTAGAAIDRDMATPNTLLGCPGHIDIGQRTVPELRRLRPRHGADVAGVRQFLQHHVRRTGQPDAAARR